MIKDKSEFLNTFSMTPPLHTDLTMPIYLTLYICMFVCIVNRDTICQKEMGKALHFCERGLSYDHFEYFNRI